MAKNGSCDGCIMFKDVRWCSIVNAGRDKDCPCRACLIKVMCRYSCEEYQIYVGTFIEENIEKE